MVGTGSSSWVYELPVPDTRVPNSLPNGGGNPGPGIGRWVYESIQLRDYPVVQSMTLVIAVVFVITNLIVDLSYAWLDPRVRYR